MINALSLTGIKEWAYAGLFFDLAGAIYSGIAVSGKLPQKTITYIISCADAFRTFCFALSFFFLSRLSHMIVPVTGKLAPNRQTITASILEGVP